MDVKLISYTLDALNLLLFTKNTRLRMEPGGLDEVRDWSFEKKMEELDYMLGTIQSSWEFVDFVFIVTDCSRAFTHQLVRHRVGFSFAQQSQRTVDMSGFSYVIPPELQGDNTRLYCDTMDTISDAYEEMVEEGEKPENARGVLPTNVVTAIVVKANLRSLAEAAKLRLCYRAQGEHREFMVRALAEVVAAFPWAEKFIKVYCAVHGSCAFPNHEGCPLKKHTYNPDTARAHGDDGEPDKPQAVLCNKAEIEKMWSEQFGNLERTTTVRETHGKKGDG